MRLIDVDAFKADYRMADECKDCKTNVRACEYDRVYAKMEFCSWLDDAPTVAPERMRGKWIPVTNGRGGHECSLCHTYAPSFQTGNEWLTDYCPKCGADMRGEQDE